MALTVNNVGTLSLLNVLNKTTDAQQSILEKMSTGFKINRGADDPAGLLAISKLDNELTAVNAGIASNQRTDAVLGVADNALSEIGSLVNDIQRLASATANDAALTAEEVAANQAQIDDALSSIDRIVSTTNFNGKKLIDGSLGINSELTAGAAGDITDVRIFSRTPGTTDVDLTIGLTNSAATAVVSQVMVTSATADTTFSVQGKLGTAVITALSTENVSSVAYKINQTKSQTGVSAVMSTNGVDMNLNSVDKGTDAFVRTKLIDGNSISDKSDTGTDAVVSVNGQTTAVDGDHVAYSGNGINISFDLGASLTSTCTLQIKGKGDGDSGATFQLGGSSATRATLGIDGVYSAQLGNATDGYLRSLGSGGANSLITDPNGAATVARKASLQVATLQGRIGGFQKFQVRTSINSLNDAKEGLEKAKGVINDVDYAVASAELNRQNVLLQSAMSLLGLANQQSSQVLSLLR